MKAGVTSAAEPSETNHHHCEGEGGFDRNSGGKGADASKNRTGLMSLMVDRQCILMGSHYMATRPRDDGVRLRDRESVEG
jgi:hypothetical protein